MDMEYFSSTQVPPPTQPPLNLSPEEDAENSGIPLSPTITARLFYLALAVDRYYTPVLFLFGSIGNCLSIIVFFSKSHNARGSLSSSVYLSALALSDTGFLINLFIMWLDNMGTSLLTNSFICKSVMYSAQVMGFLSVWFIVAFTVERFFAVCYPLFRISSKCTASRARKIALGLTLFAAIGFSYVLVIADVQAFQLNQNDGESGRGNSTFSMSSSHDSLFDLSSSSSSQEGGIRSEEDSQFSNRAGIFSSDTVQHIQLEKEVTTSTFQVSDTRGNSNVWKDATTIDTPTSKHPEDHHHHDEEPEFAYMCSVSEKYHGISRVYTYIDSILTFIVPFLLIAVLNLKIIFCVKQIKGHRESMLATTKIYHYRQKSHKPKIPPSSSGRQEDGKLRNFFNKFHYIKKSAGPRGRKLCKKSQDAINCRQHKQHQQQGEESAASCSNTKNPKYYQRGSGDDKNCVNGVSGGGAMQSLLEKVPSIDVESDSPSSPCGGGGGVVTPPNFKPINQNLTNHNATEIRVTKTLLLVSSVFLLLHFPSHSIRVAAFIVSIGSSESKETFQKLNVAQHWANILFNTNFAINFLLYCCSGKAFRRSIKNLFTKDFLLSRRNPNRSPRNASTTMLTSNLTLQPDSASTSCKYSTTRLTRHQHFGTTTTTRMEEDQL